MTIEIQNVGPIHSLTIPLPDGGGVVRLRGPNGSGKSTALAAVDSAARGVPMEARARRGTKSGTVEGLGIKLSVGPQRMGARKGELTVDAFDQRIRLGDLVDPGLKDADAANRKRIQTLCAIAGIEPDAERFRALCADLDDSALRGELVEVAARVRAELHRRAREHETRATEQAERARTLFEQVADVDGAPAADVAQAALESAIGAESALKARAAQAGEAQQRAAKARAELERIGAEAPDLDALREAARIAGDRASEATELVDEIQKRLREAMADMDAANVAERQALRDVEAAEQAAADRIAARKALEEATAVADAPTDGDLSAAHDAVAQARADVARAAQAERAAEQRAKAQAAEEAAKTEHAKAEALRYAATRTDTVLVDHLSSVMPEGLRVLDGRLVIERDGAPVDYAELSEGERWRIAIDAALSAAGSRQIIAIEQPAWEGLDADARAAIQKHARERGAWILTAEADHAAVGPLRAEVMS